jgi:hypothetical protein
MHKNTTVTIELPQGGSIALQGGATGTVTYMTVTDRKGQKVRVALNEINAHSLRHTLAG